MQLTSFHFLPIFSHACVSSALPDFSKRLILIPLLELIALRTTYIIIDYTICVFLIFFIIFISFSFILSPLSLSLSFFPSFSNSRLPLSPIPSTREDEAPTITLLFRQGRASPLKLLHDGLQYDMGLMGPIPTIFLSLSITLSHTCTYTHASPWEMSVNEGHKELILMTAMIIIHTVAAVIIVTSLLPSL